MEKLGVQFVLIGESNHGVYLCYVVEQLGQRCQRDRRRHMSEIG